MGNSAISKRVSDIPKEPQASAGHLQLWKIWPGIRKDNGEECSVWAFDKADLAKKGRRGGEITDKAVQEQIFAIMSRDMKTMKECECGGVVKVVEIVEETKSTLVFITERIVCSVADALYSFENISNGMSCHSSFFDSNGSISEMEISRGLYSLAEGLQVLHTVHRKLHLNLTPESVVFTPGGYLKLCGMGFSLGFQQGDSQRLASPYFLKAAEAKAWVRLEPDLRYCGPEATLGGLNPTSVRYLGTAEDVFALGVLVLELFRYNLKEIPEGRPHLPLVPLSNNAVAQHISSLEVIGGLDMNFLPSGLSPLLVGMVQPQPASRVSTTDICNSAFFATGSLAVLRAVDTLSTRDVGTQSSQLVALTSQLSSFPSRLLVGTVLPGVCKLCVANPALWVYALPLHVHVASPVSGRVSLQAYREAAGKFLALGLRVTQPVETMQGFLRNVSFLQDCFDNSFFAEHVVGGLFVNCLEKSQHVSLQLQALAVLCNDRVRTMIDGSSLLDVVVPKVCREACKNADSDVKVLALYFLSLIVSRLDKAYLAKNMLPSLKYITERDKAPSVSMAVVGMYESMSEALGVDYIAGSILPTLTPMLADRSLDKKQFSMLSDLVLQMTKKVLDGRTQELGLPSVPVSAPGSSLGSASDAFAAAKEVLSRTQAQSQAQAASMPYQKLALPVDLAAGTVGMGLALPPPPSGPAPSMLPPSPKTAPPPLPFGVPPPTASAYAPPSYVEPPPSILAPPAASLSAATLASAWGNSSSSSSSSTSTFQLPPDDDFLSSFSKASSAPTKPPKAVPAPTVTPTAASGLSIEEQIKQTQEQIRMLSSGMSGGPSNNMGVGMGMGMGMGVGMGMGMGMGGVPHQSQQPMGMMGFTNTPMGQNMGGMVGMGVGQGIGMGAQPQFYGSNMGGMDHAANGGGYRPPVVPAAPPAMGMQSAVAKPDPFDFLN